MRVENNIDYGVKNKNICKNNIKYCNLKSESDIVSFGMSLKKESPFHKFINIVLSLFKGESPAKVGDSSSVKPIPESAPKPVPKPAPKPVPESAPKPAPKQPVTTEPIVKPENYETATFEDLIKEWKRLGAVRENIDDVSQFKLHYELGMNQSRIESILMGTGHVQINNKWRHVLDIKCCEPDIMAQRLEDFKNDSAEDLIAQFYYVLKKEPDLEGLSSASFQAPIKLLKQKDWSFKNGSWVKQENGQTIMIPQKIRGTNYRRSGDMEPFDSKNFKLVKIDDKHCNLLLKEDVLPQENILSGIGHERTNKAYREGEIKVLSPAVVEFKDGVWTVTKELEYIINE